MNKTPLVKICGITHLEDAQLALELGAHAIGFIFYPPSPRFISFQAAGEIARQLPPYLVRVGVFVQAGAEEINQAVETTGLDRIQLHGGEPYELMAQLSRSAYRAFRPSSDSEMEAIKNVPDETLMLDGFDPQQFGGTGKKVNTEWAADLARHKKIILAGGLNPETIGPAIKQIQPQAVDISSGVESAPGIKDPKKMKQLFEALKDF